jgi:hypothetical protein
MNSAIELHDSECLAIERDSRGNGALILDAYIHRTNGEPSPSPREGGWQRVRLAIECLTPSREIDSLPATIYKGSLEVGGSRVDDLIPLPSSHSGDVSLTLVLLDDERMLSITGKNISIGSQGDFRFVEHVNLH